MNCGKANSWPNKSSYPLLIIVSYWWASIRKVVARLSNSFFPPYLVVSDGHSDLDIAPLLPMEIRWDTDLNEQQLLLLLFMCLLWKKASDVRSYLPLDWGFVWILGKRREEKGKLKIISSLYSFGLRRKWGEYNKIRYEAHEIFLTSFLNDFRFPSLPFHMFQTDPSMLWKKHVMWAVIQHKV